MSFLSQTNLSCMCSHWGCCEKEGAGVARFRNRCEILESQLAAAHAEGEEQARLLGMSGSREAKLLAEIDGAKAEIENWQARTKELLTQKDGVDPDVFGTVCYERDVAMDENKRLREALEKISTLDNPVLTKSKMLSLLETGISEANTTWRMSSIARAALDGPK